MANYTCEEASVCTEFQLAICLHCNRRLCLTHITEHNKIIFNSFTNLSNEVKTTFQLINEESEKRKNIFNNVLTSVNQWQTQQIEKIQHIYDNHLKLIEFQREILNHAEVKLFEQLEQNALQPLEQIQRQQNVNMEIINHIQQTIKKVREDNAYLKWKLVTPSPSVDVEYSPLNIPSISVPVESSKSDNNKSISKQPVTKMTNVAHPEKGRSLKRLVTLFGNISSIEKAKNDITVYFKKLGTQFRLPVVICSYLTAWNKKSSINEKVFLLNEHIITIQKYLINCQSDFDVLIGIQVFFYNENVKGNKNEMMTFLLQFFLNHQCIDQHQILNWYNNRDVHGVLAYKGFQQAKHLATPFIESLSTIPTVNNVRTVSIDPTSVVQSLKIEIKQEPTAMT